MSRNRLALKDKAHELAKEGVPMVCEKGIPVYLYVHIPVYCLYLCIGAHNFFVLE